VPIKKSMLLAGAITTLGAASAIGLSTVSAASSTNGEQTLVDKLASRFNLNKDEVQKVFDEEHATHQAEREAKLEERLSQAVKDGKLTEEQKTKIIAKLKEMKSEMKIERGTLDDGAKEELHKKMEERHAELEKWAKENNIPMEYLRPTGGHGKFHVKFRGEGGGDKVFEHSIE
jgi:hypothetical protein